MILFKFDMAQAILEGRKTVTRRRGKRRWKVGALHQCYTRPAFARPPGEPFARVRIVSVTFEANPGSSIRLGGNTVADYDAWFVALHAEGQREGFDGWVEFGDAYERINGYAAIYQPCWRVEFALVEHLAPVEAQVKEA